MSRIALGRTVVSCITVTITYVLSFTSLVLSRRIPLLLVFAAAVVLVVVLPPL